MAKINPITYYIHDCILRGWRNVGYSFQAWSKLMTSNYSSYDIFDDTNYPYTPEEKEKSTYHDFWDSMEDDIYPKEFIEYLLDLCEEVQNGTAQLIPWEKVRDEIMVDMEKKHEL
ncbi:hypothetical protein b3_0126 [Synechococcus phage B3]|nr:hypothetical protein b3_0126 [Synechococcus phage B3]QGT54740.1 hypothetical protein b23_0125 [Synechococcus phage B23]